MTQIKIIVFTLLFLVINLESQSQTISAPKLIGKWEFVKVTSGNPNIKYGKGPTLFIYEFMADSVYTLRYDRDGNSTVNSGRWSLEKRKLHLTENTDGVKDPGSLADARDYTIVNLNELELALRLGDETLHFKKQQ